MCGHFESETGETVRSQVTEHAEKGERREKLRDRKMERMREIEERKQKIRYAGDRRED